MLVSSSRAFSPPLSTVSSAHGSSSPVQFKKVVVEGRSKHDGASLRMYLKLSVALDNVQSGSLIPLFPEENIRIIQSKVHPLDERSVPYYFSSTDQPLLQRTAAALQLAPKSSRHYHTLFPRTSSTTDHSAASSSRRNRGEGTSSPTMIDEKYTGHILVSGYHVTLRLPKEIPSRIHSPGTGPESDADDGFVKDVPSSWSARSSRRNSSLFPKNILNLMIGLEVYVPYVLTPPKGPFLISIPVPRCLDNHLKLRISTPHIAPSSASTPRSSFTSASSEDDTPGWDFLTDPPVSRKADKSLRRNSYHQSTADDELSDTPSAPSAPGTELIQGAFQSTDILHVRWAPPLGRRSGAPKTEDGMRRIGVERTVGKMNCEVLGRDRNGVLLAVTYEGTCTGLWHPGVATILGMDIALDVKGRRISWPDHGTPGWAVTGKDGFGGLYTEVIPPEISRQSSVDTSSSSTFLPSLINRPLVTPARGSASLLRAPLPNQHTPDYSFENSPSATPPASGVPYLQPATTPVQDVRISRADLSPGKTITLKVNLMKLLPPAKNELNFSVCGTIFIDTEEEDFLSLPAFRVLGSDRQSIDTIVSSRTANTTFQLGKKTANAPRRTPRKGEEVHCEEDVGIILRSLDNPVEPVPSPTLSIRSTKYKTSARSHTQTPASAIPVTPHEDVQTHKPLPQLPCVLATITPLLNSPHHTHCVRVDIPMYSLNADTIEFRLSDLHPPSSPGGTKSMPVVDVLHATFAGLEVPVKVLRQVKASPLDSHKGQIMDDDHTLVVVQLGNVEVHAGAVKIVYLIGKEHNDQQNVSSKSKGKRKEEIGLDVLLPYFQLPIAQYEVEVDCPLPGFTPNIKYSTLLDHSMTQSKTLRLAQYRLPIGFFPALSLSLVPSPSSENTLGQSKGSEARRLTWIAFSTITYITLFSLLFLNTRMVYDIRDTMHAAAQALVRGGSYSDIYWGHAASPYDAHQWRAQEQSKTTLNAETPTTTSIIWQQETIRPVTPTIDLSEATPIPQQRSPHTKTRLDHARALIPFPAVPLFSLRLPISAETKEFIIKGLIKAWYLIRKAWNFPMDPD